MGWAIQRPDGTYRAWNANTKDDVLQAGEIWVPQSTSPEIPSPPRPANPLIMQIDVTLASTDIPPVLKALLRTWQAQL